MAVSIEDANDLTVNLYGIGNPNRTGQSPVDSFGDSSLAGPRKAGEEQRPSGINDAAERLQQRVSQHQIAETPADSRERCRLRWYRLQAHHVGVITQRNGSGPRVATDRNQSGHSIPAVVQHRVARRSIGRLNSDFDQFFAIQALKDFFS